MNITIVYFGVVFAITLLVVVGIWSARSRMRVIRERYVKLYKKIPASTLVTLTREERKFYRFIGVGVIIVWIAGMAAFLVPRCIAIYPFYTNHAEEIPITIVDKQEVRLTKKGVSYYKFLLSAEVDGRTVEDAWTVAPSWFTVRQGEAVDGLMYRNGNDVELGIASAISPVFRWQQIVGMIGVTFLAWFLAITQFRLARSKQVRFDRLSMIDKTQRAGKVK